MLRSAALVSLFMMAAPCRADACTCAPAGPPCAEYWKATAVFRGRAERIVRGNGIDASPVRVVTFEVTEGLKGIRSGSTVTVRTADSARSCGTAFAAGREYVVYAWTDADGVLTSGRCQRTRAVEAAADDLSYARSVAAGGAPLGRVSGRLMLRSRDLARAKDREQPLANIWVVVQSMTHAAGARTDAAGRFAVDGLPPGTYTARAEVEGRVRHEAIPPTIELADPRGCATAALAVLPDGRVGGRVVDARGRPLSGLTVDLTVASGIDRQPLAAGPERLRTVSGRDGTYELAGVPPGRFVVGINTRQDAVATPQPRVFHPGVPDVGDATSVDVSVGGRVQLPDFVMPAGVEFVHLTGMVVDAGGAPAEGARVFLQTPDASGFILSEPVYSDFVGRFTIAVPADQVYRVFAERPRPGDSRGRLDSSESLTVAASTNRPTVKLVLRRP